VPASQPQHALGLVDVESTEDMPDASSGLNDCWDVGRISGQTLGVKSDQFGPFLDGLLAI
jgi:hypothetical protein